MDYRRLGRSGLKVSTVGLGSWLTYGNAVENRAGRDCVRAAVECGINLLDTADVYARGEAERFLGDAIADLRREDLVVGTKVFGKMSDGINDRGLCRKHVMESCHASLKRLQTDYVDLYQCHRYDPDTPLEEVVRAMGDLIRQGKVLYWGVSCWEPDQIGEACDLAARLLVPAPISNQPPYNMLERDIEAEVVPACTERGLSQIVYSPLAQGLLTGKYQGGAVPPGSRLANDKINRFMKERLTEENFHKLDQLEEIARDLKTHLATLALAWCLREQNVASVIMGATRPEQVRSNAAAADLELSRETLDRIEEILTAGAAA